MEGEQVELTVIRVKLTNKHVLEAVVSGKPELGMQRILDVKNRKLFRPGDRLLCRALQPECWELAQAEPQCRARLRLQEEEAHGEREHTAEEAEGAGEETDGAEEAGGTEEQADSQGDDKRWGFLRRVRTAAKGLTKNAPGAGEKPAPVSTPDDGEGCA